ncbi:MAG: type III-B CRISPR module-associated Cmr3 family protein [Thermoguttaceae bacterium]|jgi:CRISPR-associated protein Cmr3|nr:type III-B CRISPR module-associated Cmr3 family protein [Thermoguttaceae bacterium]
MTETVTPIDLGGRLGLLLEPLDVLFFRDGRPFGASLRGESLSTALPQTLAGAVWTALLQACDCNFQELTRRVRGGESFRAALDALGLPAWIAEVQTRGPWLARVPLKNPADAVPEVLFPMPASLHVPKKANGSEPKLVRLTPLAAAEVLPGWKLTRTIAEPALRPLWHRVREATEPARGFLKPEGMRAFLCGDDIPPDTFLKAEALYGFDHRTGIGISADTMTAEKSLIYTANFLALRTEPAENRQVVMYAEIQLPQGAPEGLVDGIRTIAFGGEGRRVAVHRLPVPFDFAGLSARPSSARGNSLVVLTTPCPCEARWKPAALADRVVAAAMPGAVAVSGWDLARGGPKPSRFAVPAGSVYFAEGELTNLPLCLADSEADRRQGWGCYLTGVWNHDSNRC